MKHNIIFALLTAVILVSGFYAMNITEYFTKNTPDEDFRSVSRIESSAVYLSSDRNIPDPMSSINPINNSIPTRTRATATATVKAMARNNDVTPIAWGIDIPDLNDAWQSAENGYIYVDKWKYKNCIKKQDRLLDCILDTSNYRVVYIRFYCDTEYNVSANDMNSGLKKFDNESNAFYSNINSFLLSTEKYLSEHEEDSLEKLRILYYLEHSNNKDFNFINSYKYFNKIILDTTSSRLASFWIAPLGILYFYGTSYEINELVFPTSAVLDEFINNSPAWLRTSYSSRDGRIYQTININDRKLTVIYCVTEDIIEGYYFE